MTNVNGVNQKSGSRNRKERKNLIQEMDVEMGERGNCIGYKNLRDSSICEILLFP